MRETHSITELVPERLYFASVARFFLRNAPNTIYITADESDYPEIQSYFGPPSISDIYKYCTAMEYLYTSSEKKIIHWSSYLDSQKYTNAVFLIGTFLLLYFQKTDEEVIEIARNISQGRAIPFRDTTNMSNEPTLDIKYFFSALYKCIRLNWFNMENFDVENYDDLSSLSAGDMNWIVPGKLIALSCPLLFTKNEYVYIKYFQQKNVVAVVQLNAAKYDKEMFTRHGIRHYNLYFADGTVPNKAITKRFLAVAECTPGAIAVHCRAGLGRTGTLIGAYIIRHYDLSALETTAWIRLCRPGSVIGLQQRFLQVNEKWLKTYNFQCNRYANDLND